MEEKKATKKEEINEQEKIEDILTRIIKSGHMSVLEHASFTFGVEGVSRALLAQLTRHRIASFSVQSQRYVRFDKKTPDFVIPPKIAKDENLLNQYNEFLKISQDYYNKFLAAGIPAEDARYVLPNAEVMIHQPLGGAQGQAEDIKIAAEHILKIREKMNRILAANTGQPLEKIEADTDRDNYLDAEEAVAYGLADKVVEKR